MSSIGIIIFTLVAWIAAFAAVCSYEQLRNGVGAGLLLSFAFASMFLVERALPSSWSGLGLVFMGIFLALPVLFSFVVAMDAGNKAAIMTCVVPALIRFGIGYASDVNIKAQDDGHTLLNIVGYVSPFDLSGQFIKLLHSAGWFLFMALFGIGVKELYVRHGWLQRKLLSPQVVLYVFLFFTACAVSSFAILEHQKLNGGYRNTKPRRITWRHAAENALAVNNIAWCKTLLANTDPVAREEAARAIANNDVKPSEMTLPLFADMLASSDGEVQYSAMYGLFNLAIKLRYNHKDLPPMPGIQHFRENRDSYVNTWRAWLAANRDNLLLRIRQKYPEQ